MGGRLLLVLSPASGCRRQLYTGQERTVTTIFMFVALAASVEPHRRVRRLRLASARSVFFGIGGYATAVADVATGMSTSGWRSSLSGLLAAVFGALIGRHCSA